MFRKLLFMVIITAFVVINAQEIPFVVYDFENQNLVPIMGNSSFTLVGGAQVALTDSHYPVGWNAETNSGTIGYRLSTNTYPAASAYPETAGIAIMVNTVGIQNVHLKWNTQASNTGANRIRLQYTVDGSNWFNFVANSSNATNYRLQNPAGPVEFDDGKYVMPAGSTWMERTADFTSIPAVNDNANFGIRLVTAFPTGSNSYVAANSGSNYGSAGTQGFDNITFSYSDPNMVAMPLAIPGGGVFTEPIEVVLTCATPNAQIYYTLDNSDPSESSSHYTTEIFIANNATLKFRAYADGLSPSGIVTENYIFPITLNSLAELRSKTPGTGERYILPFEVIVSAPKQMVTTHTQYYIQDDTAAIVIHDAGSRILTTEYAMYDGISNLQGTLAIYTGMYQFEPIADPGPPSSTSNVLLPIAKTIPEVISNFNDLQAQLIVLQSVKFVELVEDNFRIAQVYKLRDQQGNTMNFRATFGDVDYLGSQIPTDLIDLAGILTERTEGKYITARFWSDFLPPTNSSFDDPQTPLTHHLLGNYPNPFNPNTTIVFELQSTTSLNLSIYNIRGQKVVELIANTLPAGKHTVHWNGTDSNLQAVASGIYFYKLETPETIEYKKALLLK